MERGYDHWSIMMKTLFQSHDFLELLDKGFSEQVEKPRLKENRKKDAKALCLTQQALHWPLFSRIAVANTAKEAYGIPKYEFQGNPKVMAVKIQALR